jgi:phosphate uptake regulator
MVIINRQPPKARRLMRKTFETDIQQLKDELLILGSMVEQQILGAVESLKTMRPTTRSTPSAMPSRNRS